MRLDWKAVVGIVVTVVLLWWVLKGVDFAEVWVQVRRGDMALLAAAVFVATFGFLIRAVRWKVLLAPLKPDTRLHSRFAAVSVGFMTNNVLPARLGEFTRAYAFSRIEPVSVSGAFGTLVVERVLDGLTLLGLLLFTVSWPTFPGGDVLDGTSMGRALDGIVVILGVLIVGMIVLMVRPRPFVRFAERVAARLPGDFARPVVDALEAFLDSLAVLRSPTLLTKAVFWSVVFWVWHGLSFWLGMLAFGIRPQDSLIAAFFVEAVVGFGVAVPSAPGFLGTFQAAADWALQDVYGVDAARSLAFAFGYYFGGWLPITAIGLWYAWKLGLSLGDMRRSEEEVESAVEASYPVAARLLADREDRPQRSRQNPEPVAAAVEIDAPAKINLHLRVLGRDDASGYHDLETLFQAVDLRDRIRIEPADRGMDLEVVGADVGPPRENLVWAAAAAFAAETAFTRGLRIRLTKRIPAGAGLGGGSSDAAATLRALNALFGDPVPRERLHEIGARLGADVPFFLGTTGLALGLGRGDRLTGLTALPDATVVLALPGVHVSTAEAYAALAERRAGAPPPAPVGPARDGRVGDWEELAGAAVNDFEAVAEGLHPDLTHLRRHLSESGAVLARMSGSGSAVYGVFLGAGAAREAAAALEDRHPDVRFVVADTLAGLPGPELAPGAGGARG